MKQRISNLETYLNESSNDSYELLKSVLLDKKGKLKTEYTDYIYNSTSFTYNKKEDRFEWRLYLDRGENPKEFLLNIIEDFNSKKDGGLEDYFREKVQDAYMEIEFEIEKNLINATAKYLSEIGIESYEYDDIRELIVYDYFMIDFEPIFKTIYRTDVQVALVLNANDDMNYEGYNNLISDNDNSVTIKEITQKGSSWGWLLKSQGYTPKQLQNAIIEEVDEGKFINSCRKEIRNMSYGGFITFLGTMTIKDFLEIKSSVKGRSSITVSKDCTCGIYGPYNGSGSILGIELEKNIQIPYNSDKWRLDLDNYSEMGYDIQDVFSLASAAFKGGIW